MRGAHLCSLQNVLIDNSCNGIGLRAMRKLKYHEQKLLRKVNFFDYKKEKNVREIKILRKYHIQKREDYHKYVLSRPLQKN